MKSHLAVALAFALAASLMLVALPASAQKLAPEAAFKNDTGNLQLNATNSDLPVLTQLSEKGIYKVQLTWPQYTLNPQGEIQVGIAFMNASAPEPSEQTVPQRESNVSGGPDTDPTRTVPGTLQFLLPIDSYDMIIYSSDGKELWKKVDQPGLGGQGTQNVRFASNYTGPVTIEINNIKPGWDTGGTATASDITDSVKFTATIVPEFPVVAALLAASVAGMIVAGRFWTARRLR